MSIFRTIALFVYLFGYMIVHYSVLCKAERALAAGDTETVRQLVKKRIPHTICRRSGKRWLLFIAEPPIR